MKVQNNSDSIMDCSVDFLKETCLIYLSLFDDYQQEAGENKTLQTFLTDSYNELETLYFLIKECPVISVETRNAIRLLLKDTVKVASVQLVMNNTIAQ